MNDLRACLREITEGQKSDTHPQLIQDLGHTHHHSIELAEGPAPRKRYTCVMHALDLIEDPEYIAIVQAAPRDVFASPRFVQRLIDQGHLMELAQPEQGALIVYFENEAVTHIGRLLSETRVESKWGTGHLWHHGVFEVPSNYGSVVRFFQSVDRDLVLDCYVEYALEHGVRFKGDDV